MTNAFSFWPSAGCTNAIAATTDDSGCNGDGNGQVDSVAGVAYERLRFWQHLTLAGMIPGTYSGTFLPNAFTSSDTIGVNVPATKLSNVGFSFGFRNSTAGQFCFFINTGHFFNIGRKATVSALARFGTTVDPFLTPPDAYTVDMKYDDGIPTQGKWQVYVGTVTNQINLNCTNNSTSARQTGDAYNLSYESQACSFNVRL